MSSGCTTPDMAVMSQAVPVEAEYSRMNRFTAVLAGGVCIAAVFGGSGEAVAHEGSTQPNTGLSALDTTGIAPDFTQVGACNYPGEFGSHDAADRLAAKTCLKYGLKGPDGKGADVVMIDLTDAPMSKLKDTANELEKLAIRETGGVLKLDVKIVQPPEAAQDAVDEFLSTGCVDPHEAAGSETPLVVDIAVEQMPELNGAPHVIAVSDAYTCNDILGYSNMKSRIDMFNARLSEVSAKLLARVGLHEIFHNFGFGHEQTASNGAIISATKPIESKYYTDGVFDSENFLKNEVTYGAVLNGGDTLMGAINPAVKRQPLNGFQLSRFDWARRVLKLPGTYKTPELQDNKSYSFNRKSKRPQAALIPLGSYKTVFDYKLDKNNQMSRIEEQAIAWNAHTVIPEYTKNNKTVKGARFALGNTMDASEAVMGMFTRDKTKKETVIRIPLPGGTLEYGNVERTEVITMTKRNVSVVIESVPASDK